jgi:hypothetical protein
VKFVSIRQGLDTSHPYWRFVGNILLSVAAMTDNDRLAELTPEQFNVIKSILPSEQFEKLEPYIDVIRSVDSEDDD